MRSRARALLLVALASAPAGAAPPAGEQSWLEIRSPERAVAYRAGGDSDAVVPLTLANRSDRQVRVERVWVSYLRDDAIVPPDRREAEILDTPAGTAVSRRIERGGEAEWPGLCLEKLPPGVDRVRLEFELSARRGLARSRSSQSLTIDVVEAPSPAILALPFEGFWRVTQGHGCRTRHRLGGHGGEFAWDFVAVDSRSGRGANVLYPLTRRNRDAVSFGRSVLAPVDGRVVRVENEVPDNEGLREFPRRSLLEDLSRPLWFFGNFVVIEAEDGRFVLLAHLQKGSIRVSPGDRVRRADPIASCGNSGSTIEPHLHVQVMDRPDPLDPAVSGVPAVFADYTEILTQEGGDHRDSLLRRRDRGDPPEGAVIAPPTTMFALPRAGEVDEAPRENPGPPD